jgi:hypothetical protein
MQPQDPSYHGNDPAIVHSVVSGVRDEKFSSATLLLAGYL